MEDKAKVDAKVTELNSRSKDSMWRSVDGFKALTDVTFGKTREDATFSPGSGYPVKIFVDVVSGEVKIFSAYLFEIKK